MKASKAGFTSDVKWISLGWFGGAAEDAEPDVAHADEIDWLEEEEEEDMTGNTKKIGFKQSF